MIQESTREKETDDEAEDNDDDGDDEIDGTGAQRGDHHRGREVSPGSVRPSPGWIFSRHLSISARHITCIHQQGIRVLKDSSSERN